MLKGRGFQPKLAISKRLDNTQEKREAFRLAPGRVRGESIGPAIAPEPIRQKLMSNPLGDTLKQLGPIEIGNVWGSNNFENFVFCGGIK